MPAGIFALAGMFIPAVIFVLATNCASRIFVPAAFFVLAGTFLPAAIFVLAGILCHQHFLY